MRAFTFSKFSPAGNTTVFLHAADQTQKAHYCARALAAVGGEQAAFANIERRAFSMGGGELCVNACRAFGALIDLAQGGGARRYAASTDAGPIELDVSGACPRWEVSVTLELADVSVSRPAPGVALVGLPGIQHLLLAVQAFPRPEEIAPLAMALLERHNLAAASAAGVSWWKSAGPDFEILPFVRVAESGTAMPESSCGSATLALGAALGRPVSVLQPSGAWLGAALVRGRANVSGPVCLVATGSLWLDEP